jgi:hypothetical protein
MIEYCDYSVYEHKNEFRNKYTPINIRIHIIDNDPIDIIVNVNETLEDLYIKVYNKLYPEYSVTKEYLYSRNRDVLDTIPPKDIELAPGIKDILICDESNKNVNVKSIPIHRIITVSSFIKSNKTYFNPNNNGIYSIYIIEDEYAIRRNNKLKMRNIINRFICNIR